MRRAQGGALNKNGVCSCRFRFIATWQNHPKFAEFHKSIGKEDGDIATNVECFTSEIKVWNKNVFSHMRKRKR